MEEFAGFVMGAAIFALLAFLVFSGLVVSIGGYFAVQDCERNLLHYKHCSWHIVATEDKK